MLTLTQTFNDSKIAGYFAFVLGERAHELVTFGCSQIFVRILRLEANQPIS